MQCKTVRVKRIDKKVVRKITIAGVWTKECSVTSNKHVNLTFNKLEIFSIKVK